ncbi:MAG TPA: SrtB family sortase [Lachnospiraceae bacterium]|nr:SrtB family sortase [Lachnospiraceae bacterium]
MDRFKTDKSMQDKIDKLSKENARLRLMLEKQDYRKNKVKKRQRRFRIIGAVLIITGLVFLGLLMYGTYSNYKRARDIKKLQEQRASAAGGNISPDGILPEYRKMYKTNSDLAGWIVIDGTDINYPVVQSKIYQEFYLDHNFDGEEDEAGSIFVDARNDVFLPDDNIIIYGHNMKNGSMFGTLQHYLDKDYYDSHSIVSFDTLYKHRIYKIAAVGLSKISDESDDTFKYYDFLNAEDKKSFKEYVKNIKSLEAYETGVDLKYGDKLVTLSTCNSVEEDGRLFIVAKEVNKNGKD